MLIQHLKAFASHLSHPPTDPANVTGYATSTTLLLLSLEHQVVVDRSDSRFSAVDNPPVQDVADFRLLEMVGMIDILGSHSHPRRPSFEALPHHPVAQGAHCLVHKSFHTSPSSASPIDRYPLARSHWRRV